MPSRTVEARPPGDQSHRSPIIGDTDEERASLTRRGTLFLRSCFAIVIATMIFEGVVLGGIKFGWVGAILGPFAIYAVSAVIGVLSAVILIGVTTFGDRPMRPKPPAGGGPRPLPPGDEQLDGPMR